MSKKIRLTGLGDSLRDHQPGAGAERHRDVGHERAAFRARQQRGFHRHHLARAVEEEIAERHRDRGRRRAVPVDFELEAAQRFGRAVLDRHPHAVDGARALDVGEHVRGADRDGLERVALGALVLAGAGALGSGRVLGADPMSPLVGAVAVEVRAVLRHGLGSEQQDREPGEPPHPRSPGATGRRLTPSCGLPSFQNKGAM